MFVVFVNSSLTFPPGGAYGGAGIIKDRLLPWLGQGLVTVGGLSADTSLNILADVAAKDRELGEVQDMYERSIQNLQADLTQTRLEADDLKKEYVFLVVVILWLCCGFVVMELWSSCSQGLCL